MTGPDPATPTYYRPADVARMLRCSPWWVKEQARRRRIPYSWIGGSYLFTAEHVAEIVRLFEVQPTEPVAPASRRPPALANGGGSVVQLTARIPRRLRTAAADAAA